MHTPIFWLIANITQQYWPASIIGRLFLQNQSSVLKQKFIFLLFSLLVNSRYRQTHMFVCLNHNKRSLRSSLCGDNIFNHFKTQVPALTYSFFFFIMGMKTSTPVLTVLPVSVTNYRKEKWKLCHSTVSGPSGSVML